MIIFIFIILILAYLLWPVVKGMMYVRDVHRNVRDAFKQAAGRGAGGNTANAPGRHRKKKIDKDVGEYVEYEEITVASATYRETVADDVQGQRRTITSESQVVDVEWEDVK